MGQVTDCEKSLIRKLTCVNDYNLHLGGVDWNDGMISLYTATRKSCKWYRKVATHILEQGMNNAYLIYTFRSYKSPEDRDWPIFCSPFDAESTGFGPKRLGCSVRSLFPIEHGVHQSPGHRACRLQLTACLGEFLSLELNLMDVR